MCSSVSHGICGLRGFISFGMSSMMERGNCKEVENEGGKYSLTCAFEKCEVVKRFGIKWNSVKKISEVH